jgi:hypothetical protein
MKLVKATALIAVFLVENAFSFAHISTALTRSITKSVSVPFKWKNQCRLQDVPRPEDYNDSNANLEQTVPGFLAGTTKQIDLVVLDCVRLFFLTKNVNPTV